MKLLFITQKIDREDDVLGVYHEWAKRLADAAAKLNVICLYKGLVNLPSGVGVFSLGKEKRRSRAGYLFNFFKYIWKLRKEYDVVFVHMNPAYIVLGWFFWKFWGKKIVYWNASYKISPLMRLGLFLADRGVTSVPEAFAVQTDKIITVGQGIDVNKFRRLENIERGNDLLSLGRISPIKNIEKLIEAVSILKLRGINAKLDIFGKPDENSQSYYADIEKGSKDLEKNGLVKFKGSVPNFATPAIYNSHKIFVNLTDSGSFDKSILEAMACQTPVLVSNKIYERIFGEDLGGLLMFKEKDPDDLAHKIGNLLKMGDFERENLGIKLRQIVEKEHNLDNLIPRLVKIFDNLQ